MSPRRRPPRDLVDVMGVDRTSGGKSRPERTIQEVINAPDGSARRGLTPRKFGMLSMDPLSEWECSFCGSENARHWRRCPGCGASRH